MILKSLELHNYRRYKDVLIEFPAGLMGIVGNNGAGKSTLIESIGWCLYGNHAARTDKDNIKRTGCAPTDNCKVTLELVLGDDSVRVERELRGRNNQDFASIFINGESTPHATGTSDVTDYIIKRTGMDRIAFFTSVFAKQKELNALSDLQPAKRKETILRLLRIDRIDTAITNVRSDIRLSQEKISGIKLTLEDMDQLIEKSKMLEKNRIDKTSQIKTGKNEIDLAKKSVLVEEKKFQDQESRRNNHTTVLSKIEKFDEREHGITVQMRNDQSDLEDATHSKNEYDALSKQLNEFKKIQKEKDTLDKILPKYNVMTTLQDSMSEINAEISDHHKTLAEISRQLVAYKKLDDDYKTNSHKISSEEKKRKNAEASINQLKAKIKALVTDEKKIQAEFVRIKNLGKKSDCPTCKRQLGDHLPTIMKHYQQETKRINAGLKKFNELEQKEQQRLVKISSDIDRLMKTELKIRNKTTERTKLETRLNETRKQILSKQHNVTKTKNQLKKFSGISYDESRHEMVRDEFDRLSKINTRCIELKRDAQRIPMLKARISSLNKSIIDLRSKIKTEKSRLQNIRFDEDEYKQAKESLDDTKDAYHQKRETVIQQEGDLRQINTEIAQNQQTIEKQRQDHITIESEERKVGLRSKLEKILVDFKMDLISRIRPMLASRATVLFRQITNGKYASMDIDEEYNVKIEDQGESFGIERFSGGEEDLANLCLRIAISQEISERTGGIRANFIVLDEIFGSQDTGRKNSILKALTELSNQFRQTMVITHIEDIKESLPYVLNIKDGPDNIATVETEGKYV